MTVEELSTSQRKSGSTKTVLLAESTILVTSLSVVQRCWAVVARGEREWTVGTSPDN